MAVHFIDGKLGGTPTLTTTTQEFPLGQERVASDGNTYIYGQANGAINQYDTVLIDEDHQFDQLTTTLSGAVPTPVGFAQIAFADNEYGWIVIRGDDFTVKVSDTVGANAKVYTSATAGRVAKDTGDLIQGLRLNDATTAADQTATASAKNGAYTNAQD